MDNTSVNTSVRGGGFFLLCLFPEGHDTFPLYICVFKLLYWRSSSYNCLKKSYFSSYITHISSIMTVNNIEPNTGYVPGFNWSASLYLKLLLCAHLWCQHIIDLHDGVHLCMCWCFKHWHLPAFQSENLLAMILHLFFFTEITMMSSKVFLLSIGFTQNLQLFSRSHSIISVSNGKVNPHHPIKLLSDHNEDKTALAWKCIPSTVHDCFQSEQLKSITNTDVRRRGCFTKCLSTVFILRTFNCICLIMNRCPSAILSDLWCSPPASSKELQITRLSLRVSHPRQATCMDNSPRMFLHNYGYDCDMMDPSWSRASSTTSEVPVIIAKSLLKAVDSYRKYRVKKKCRPGCPCGCHDNQWITTITAF